MRRATPLLLLASFFALLSAAPLRAQAPPAPAAPDVLIFTNGDQLTGHLERAAAGSVVFHSDMAGELTIPLDKVKELRSGASFAVLRKGPPTRSNQNLVGEGDVSLSAGVLTVTPAASSSAAPTQLPAADLGYLVDAPTYDRQVRHHAGFLEGWDGALTGGATLVRSTDSTTSLTAGIALVRVVPSVDYIPKRNRSTFNLSETYGKSTSPLIPRNPNVPDAVTETNIFHTDAERDEYLSPRLYALADVAFDHDFSQGLILQQIYGAGLGYTVFSTPIQELDLKADVHYEKQKFQTGTNPNLIGTVFSETYRRALPRKLAFHEQGSFIPSWNIPADYSAHVTAALLLPVYKRLSASLSTTDSYLNTPSPGYNKNSFQFVTGVSYALK